MSRISRTPISRSKFTQIKDLDDLKEFYKIMKSGKFKGEIKCLNVPNRRIKTITDARFGGPLEIDNLDRLKYVSIKYDEDDEEKRIKIEVPKKNAKFINKYFYEKNKNGGSRKTRKTIKKTKQNKTNKTTNRSKTVKKY
jgi:hypothetical protein